MVLLRLSWKEFRSRPVRTLLTLSSIVIGVGAVVAVALAIENARSAQKSMLRSVAGRSTFEIQAEGDAPFDQEVLSKVRSIPNVRLAAGLIRRFSVMFYGESKSVKVQFLGVDATLENEFRDYRIAEGADLSDLDQVLIDKGFAKSLRLELNGVVKFSTQSGLREATIAGFIEPQSGSSVLQGGLVYVPIQSAQRWSRARSRLDLIQVIADKQADTKALAQRIQQLLPDGMSVKAPALQSELGQESTVAMERGLLLASAFSLLLCIFIIYNTFQMNVGERRRQLGILRALGVTRDQIIRMILGEGLLLGIVGTLLGWTAGFFAARWLLVSTSNLIEIETASYQVAWLPFVWAGGLGISVSAAGAFFPAMRASKLSPAEAMRVVASGDLELSNRLLAFLGSVLLLSGLVILGLCISGQIHINHAILGSILFLLSGVVVLPTFLDKATQLVLRCIGPFLGVEGWLARRQLLRNRGRSSLTIGILFIAITTLLGLACTILDNIRNVHEWSERSLVGDFFVRATMPSMSTGQAADMPAGLTEKIEAIDGVRSVETLRFVRGRANELTVIIVAREFSTRGRTLFDIVQGNADSIYDGLEKGDVVIGSVLAERAKLKLGDLLSIETQSGPVARPIVGIVNDYVAAGLTVYLNRKEAEKLLKVEGNDAIIVDAKVGKAENVELVLRELCEQDGLLLQSQRELLKLVRAKADGVVSGLWAVLALGSLIAAFGLVNTLAMNILEQTAEIGMLRVVAMTRSQVRKLILSQALLMGLVGLIPGVFAGLFIAYLLSLSLLPTTGHSVAFVFRPWLTVGTFLIELVVVVVASLLPAERAARIPVAKAMQYQ